MIKIRRIYANWSSNDEKFLNENNIFLSSGVGYSSFDIAEGELYQFLKKSFLTKKREDFSNAQIGVEFNKQEIEECSHSAIFLPTKGYPQPSLDGSYRDLTFKEYFKHSGIKKMGQPNPFVLKGEPKWGKNEFIFGLFWEYDAMFAKKTFFNEVLKPLGIKSREVFINIKGKIAETVVQINIPKCTSEMELENSIYDIGNICDESGIRKYSQQVLDFLPPFKTSINQDICLSQEFFGEGMEAYHKIIVSKKIRDLFLKHKVVRRITDVHPIKSN